MQKFRKCRKFLVVLCLVRIGHFGNLIGGKILVRFSQKCEKKINVKFGVNKRILLAFFKATHFSKSGNDSSQAIKTYFEILYH